MRKHIFAGGNRIATVSLRGGEADEAISYYHSDHLGSSNVITDESGSQAAHYEYTPYGSVIASPDSSVIASPATAKWRGAANGGTGAKQSPIATHSQASIILPISLPSTRVIPALGITLWQTPRKTS